MTVSPLEQSPEKTRARAREVLESREDVLFQETAPDRQNAVKEPNISNGNVIQKRTDLRQSIASTIPAKKEALKEKQDVDQNLNGLNARLAKAKAAAASASAVVASTFEKKIVEPLKVFSEYMKGVASGIFQSSVGRWVERAFLNTLAPIGSVQTKFFGFLSLGTLLKPVGQYAQRNLIRMEMQDAIASAKNGENPGETITIDLPTDPELERFARWSAEKAKTDAAPSVLVLADEYIASMRTKSPGQPITLSLTALIGMDKPKSELEAEQNDLRKKKVMESWSTGAIADVRFEAGKTSFENGVLTVPVSDLLEDGKAKPNTPIGFLSHSLPELGAAQSITVIPSGEHRIEWRTDGKKAITVAMNQNVPLRILNELLSQHPPSKISVVVIGKNDRIGDKAISFTYDGTRGVLAVPTNEKLLAVLAPNIAHLNFDQVNDKGGFWDFANNGAFNPRNAIPIA